MSAAFDQELGTGPTGYPVGVVRLRNGALRVGISNYGARLLSIEAPDRHGAFDHVLLGCDSAEMVVKSGSCGAVLGRYANRIANGQFTLDGVTHHLSVNDGPNTLHGGKGGFAKLFWALAARTSTSVTFTLDSADGDQGFPGAVTATATYRLEDAALRLELTATTDRPTPLNLSAHPYFNLAGAASLGIDDHLLEVAASHFLPTDSTQIPTGAVESVEGTVFDFRTPVPLGSRIRSADPQMLVARGFDHCLVLDGDPGTTRFACRLHHPASGRRLEIETDRPALQVYTANSFNGSLVGHGGTYRMGAGLALEAQAYPDAPNHPHFPSTVVRPGESFQATILYRFAAA